MDAVIFVFILSFLVGGALHLISLVTFLMPCFGVVGDNY